MHIIKEIIDKLLLKIFLKIISRVRHTIVSIILKQKNEI